MHQRLKLQLQVQSPADFGCVGAVMVLALRAVQNAAGGEVVTGQQVVGAQAQLRAGVDEPHEKGVGDHLGTNRTALDVTPAPAGAPVGAVGAEAAALLHAA